MSSSSATNHQAQHPLQLQQPSSLPLKPPLEGQLPFSPLMPPVVHPSGYHIFSSSPTAAAGDYRIPEPADAIFENTPICWYFTDTWEQFRISGEVEVVDATTADTNIQ